MGIFGSKKKFGLAQALIVVDKKPDITPDGAKTGAAFVEALGLPVTVVAEIETKIEGLNDWVKEAEEGIKVAKTELGTVPVLAKAAVNNLNVELEKLVEAVRKAVLGKVSQINEGRDASIVELETKIKVVKYAAEVKGNKVRARSDGKVAKITDKIDAKIAEAEEKLRGDLADLKDRIANLESATKSAKAEIGHITKIKSLFA